MDSYLSFTMIYFLILSLLFLLATSAVLARNWFEFKGLKDVELIKDEEYSSLVSICIPARNEEAVIERCVTSALKQDYPNFEVLVLDDNSTDATTEILTKLSGIVFNLKHLKGSLKPNDWLGKPWACDQLFKASKGEILIYIDADVWLEPDTIKKTVATLAKKDALTIWPQQILGSFWEKMIVPLVYFALCTLLPAIYVERAPRWMPDFLYSIFKTKFVAACGQFFAFKRSTYIAVDGHESVKNQIVEDVELARIIKSKDFSLQMMHGVNAVYCRMYNDHSEVWNGFKKNFLAGFGNIFEFIAMGILHFLVFLYPIYTLIFGLNKADNWIITLSILNLALIFTQRIILSIKFKWSFWLCFLHPVSVLWFQVLGVISIINKLFGIKSTWKGRKV